MDGEVNGAETTGKEQQGVQGDQALGDEQSQRQAEEVGGGEGAGADAEYRAALADRDKKIAELEGQIAEAAKSVESANALAKEIEEMRAATDAERIGYELKLAGCRSVRAGRVLLADHKGDMAALKKAEPWLFGDAVGGGATGLEPAGASKGEGDEMRRWYEIAGIEDKE
ncbi:MAG: hypothetical protein Q4B45_00005 [Coriobacteriia bacterium]|nr:hypothetical protein [Coriobacteriia bacterium]